MLPGCLVVGGGGNGGNGGNGGGVARRCCRSDAAFDHASDD